MEEKPMLEEASFVFTQEANCLEESDKTEQIEIKLLSSLGVDREEDNYFWCIKTEGWSLDDSNSLKSLFARIEKILNKKRN